MKKLPQAEPALPLSIRISLLAGGVALLGLLLWFILPHSPALPPTASQRALRPLGVTQSDYLALRLRRDSAAVLHSTYPQAAAMMGEGSLLTMSPDGHTRRYQWNGGGRWARLEATFQDGSLVSKEQFVLRE